MTDATANNLQRLHDLLSEQATAGLSDSDQLELQKLLHDNATLQREGYELAAAAIDLALAPPNGTPMPESVRRAALMKSTMEAEPEPEAEAMVYQLTEEKPVALKRVAAAASAPPTIDVQSSEPNLPVEKPGKTGVLIAFALIGVAFLTYSVGRSGNGRKDTASGTSKVVPAAARISPATASPCDMLKSDGDALTLPWTADNPTVADVTGQVRFSVKTQQGCMQFANLPRLEKGKNVYQLWVLDADRQGPPVDGGIFEVTDKSVDSQFAFTPKLNVTNPVVFAITREPPGGVVTSANQPIIVAKVGK